MKTKELCKYLKLSEDQLYYLQKQLNIKGEGIGKPKNWTNLEIARMKAGVKYKDYIFVQDIDRRWIFYAMSDCNEVKIEI